jgi:ABC-2 type transport system ATP-binding protein
MHKNVQPIIQVDGLTKDFGEQLALFQVDFTIMAGEVVGFVGLNGAGKSTTINILLGFLRATEGTVKLYGQVITPETAHKVHKDLGYASGDMSLFDHLTGEQYLHFLEHRFHVKDGAQREKLIALFNPQLHQPIRQLSRGNKQKIALIAAFLHKPQLVILDEPSSGLDPMMQQAFLALIRSEKAAGTTILMSSHYLNEVTEVCSRVLFMRKGQLVRDMSSKELDVASGKLVKITSGTLITPPKGAEQIVQQKDDTYQVTFVYKGEPRELLTWLSLQKRVHDFSVSEHDLATEFVELSEPQENRGAA